MRNSTVKFYIFSLFLMTNTSSFAGGFESLPLSTPFATSGGTTSYIMCNPTGIFGLDVDVKNPSPPQDTCYISPAPTSDLTSPLSGFSLVSSANRPVTLNNTYSANTTKNIGNVLDVVWRNAAQTECIFGTKFSASGVDYYTTATGNQFFVANGIARGGFVDSVTGVPRGVEVAYSRSSSTTRVIYRAGRTFTSVQYRLGDAYLPLTGLGSKPSINGKDSAGGSATTAQQLADIDDNWVEFTTKVTFRDGSETPASSPMTYVKTACNSQPPAVAANAIRLRQTFQKQSVDGSNPLADHRFIEVSVSGFVPPNGVTSPTPVNPF